MSKHTPKPWIFVPDAAPHADLVVEDATGNTIAEVNIQAEDFSEVDSTVRHISRREGFANARIIIAAPEMLAALKALHAGPCSAHDEPEHRVSMNVSREAWELMEAAIAKAEGRS